MLPFKTKPIMHLLGLILITSSLNACRPFVFFHTFSFDNYTYLEKADHFVSEGKLDEAIATYKKHIEYRLSVKDRASWENPYFYYLLVGDLYLRLEKPLEALDAYTLAHTKGVEVPLVADRYRSLARWYKNHDQLKAAIELLQKYRELDDLMFDAMLDKYSKELTRQEETPHATSGDLNHLKKK